MSCILGKSSLLFFCFAKNREDDFSLLYGCSFPPWNAERDKSRSYGWQRIYIIGFGVKL